MKLEEVETVSGEEEEVGYPIYKRKKKIEGSQRERLFITMPLTAARYSI